MDDKFTLPIVSYTQVFT